MKKFILPNIGEGIETVSISEVLVKENQSIKKDDPILLVETDKASMEIPVDCSGIIGKILVNVGDLISPGQSILEISENNEVLTKEESETSDIKTSLENISDKIEEIIEPVQTSRINQKTTNENPYATPSIRKLARELGCDISNIVGSGLNKRITKEDVYNFVKEIPNHNKQSQSQTTSNHSMDYFAKFGLVEKIDLSTIQLASLKHLHSSWNNIPHVTQFDETDITELDKIVRTLKKINKSKNTKVSYLPFFIKTISYILKELNIFNTTLTLDGKSLIQKHYINVGFAVDSPKGLLVPVIKNIDKKSIKEITIAFNKLLTKTRAGKLTPNDMSGGCITISSLGNIGGKYFTPIINSPEVSILGISPIEIKPIFKNNKFIARKVLPISLSYDHRVVNGADAAKFTSLFSQIIENPSKL